jgi:hypothetical protein
MINLLFALLLIFILALLLDVYFHLRHRNILEHVLVTHNYYEKILLLKQIINSDDIAHTREKIRQNIGDRRYAQVKNLLLHYDDDYLNYLKELGELSEAEKTFDFEKHRKKIGDFIYRKDYAKASKYLAGVHRDKTLAHKK